MEKPREGECLNSELFNVEILLEMDGDCRCNNTGQLPNQGEDGGGGDGERNGCEREGEKFA